MLVVAAPMLAGQASFRYQCSPGLIGSTNCIGMIVIPSINNMVSTLLLLLLGPNAFALVFKSFDPS